MDKVDELIKLMKGLNERVHAEGRDMTASEQAEWNRLSAQVDDLVEQHIRGNRSRSIPLFLQNDDGLNGMAGYEYVEKRGVNMRTDGLAERRYIQKSQRNVDHSYWDDPSSSDERAIFNRFLKGGRHVLNADEVRALQTNLDVAGGFLSAPARVVAEIIESLDDSTFIRQMARIFNEPKAESLGAPYLEADMGDPTWTAEIRTGSEDSDMKFAKRELRPHPVARRIKVSNTLIRKSVIPPVEFIREAFARRMGYVLETNYLTGSGVNQPLGVLTASDWGITTSRDVTSTASGSVKADDLIDVLATLKEQYRNGAKWIISRDLEKRIRKLKDGEGNYLWAQGIAGDRPNTILGMPYAISEYMPTFASTNYAAILGNFYYYWIVDSLDFQVKVLEELYAETNQTGFICRYEGDGAPVLEEAFVRLKLL